LRATYNLEGKVVFSAEGDDNNIAVDDNNAAIPTRPKRTTSRPTHLNDFV